jgi:hypothetical protein
LKGNVKRIVPAGRQWTEMASLGLRAISDWELKASSVWGADRCSRVNFECKQLDSVKKNKSAGAFIFIRYD